MVVRCIRIAERATGEALSVRRNGKLTVGKAYMVIELVVERHLWVELRLMGDDQFGPELHAADQPEIVDPSIPSVWATHLGELGYLHIAPEKWLRPGFWEDYFNAVPEAVADFEEQRALIEAAQR